MDMSQFVAPKSDQLNADDLIAGPRKITITRVTGTGNADQPVAVFFDGDDNKPLKPCKSMRRVMISAWGADASKYVGRSMVLYRDPKVKFGGMEVGGIRISHMSHIERDMVMALTVTKAKREPYKVSMLREEKASPPAEDKALVIANDLIARIDGAASHAALEAITGDEMAMKQRAWLAGKRPELAKRVDDAVSSRLADFDRMDADEGIPA